MSIILFLRQTFLHTNLSNWAILLTFAALFCAMIFLLYLILTSASPLQRAVAHSSHCLQRLFVDHLSIQRLHHFSDALDALNKSFKSWLDFVFGDKFYGEYSIVFLLNGSFQRVRNGVLSLGKSMSHLIRSLCSWRVLSHFRSLLPIYFKVAQPKTYHP